MATYVILSKFGENAFREPEDIAKLAHIVADKIKSDCPQVKWKESYATTGRFDVVDVVEAPDLTSVERAALIIRAHGHSTTETLAATPWEQFLDKMTKRATTVGRG